MRNVPLTLCTVGMVLAMTALAGAPSYSRAAQLPVAGPPAHEGVTVYAPPTEFKPFDMKQCMDGSDHCQLATCVPMATPDGTIILCQGHGNFFP